MAKSKPNYMGYGIWRIWIEEHEKVMSNGKRVKIRGHWRYLKGKPQ